MINQESNIELTKLEELIVNFKKLTPVQKGIVLGFSKGLTIKGSEEFELEITDKNISIDDMLENIRHYILSLGNMVVTEKNLRNKRTAFKCKGKTIFTIQEQKTQLVLEFKFIKNKLEQDDPILQNSIDIKTDGIIVAHRAKFKVKTYNDLKMAKEYINLAMLEYDS